MPVTEYLIRNAELYPDEVALVELQMRKIQGEQLGKNLI